MRWVMLGLVVCACGEDERLRTDAAVVDADADVDAAPDASPLALDCPTYCDTVTAACTGSNAQYESAANCTATCMRITNVGALTDTTGNTLGCRIYHADLARTDPAAHCAHAGPSGGGACGTTCEAACDVIADLCPSLPANQWRNNCATSCASTGVPFTGTYATPAVMTGDTVECRLYYATAGNCDAASRTQSASCQ